MSGDNTKDPENPFLAGEELGSDLDAWDSTFDALHDDPEARIAKSGTGDSSRSNGGDLGLVARDRAITATADAELPVEAAASVEAETLEGRPTPTFVPFPPASPADFADNPTPDGIPEYDEPMPAPPRPIPVAEPVPSAVARVATKRTGPAIVRRALPTRPGNTTQRRPPLSDTKPLPMSDELARYDGQAPNPDSAALGPTVLVGEQAALEPTGAVPAQGLARTITATRSTPEAEGQGWISDDDYADMEIGGSVPAAEAGEVAPPPPSPTRRTVAHVVRRSTVPTQPPELKPEPIRPVAAPSSRRATTVDESDFSDLSEGPVTESTQVAIDDSDDDYITEPARPRRNIAINVGADSDRIGPGDSDADASPTDQIFVSPSEAQGFNWGAIRFPEQLQPLSSSQFDEQIAQTALAFERELEVNDQPPLHLEMGRLQEHLGDYSRARMHYDAALRSGPHAKAALRGLRRIACAAGDTDEALQHLDAEIAVAGAAEQTALREHRVEILAGAGAYEQARIAADDVLATEPHNVRALLASVELAFVTGAPEQIGFAVERLAEAVSDPGLRSAIHVARAIIAGHRGDAESAIAWLTSATETDISELAPRFALAQQLAAQGNREQTAKLLVELARRLQAGDPVAAAAVALRAHTWSDSVGAVASGLAARAMPSDALVARVVAETAVAGGDPIIAATAMTAWAHSNAPPAERVYAAGRAAEFDPDSGEELWSLALGLDPNDDYSAAQLRTALVAAGGVARAIEVDLQVAADASRQRARLRAGFGLMAEGQLDEALRILEHGHRDHPTSLAVTEALAEAYAAAGRWTERAQLLAELARRSDDPLDRDGMQLRSAVAWEEAVGAIAVAPVPNGDELRRLTELALETWGQLLTHADAAVPAAHAAAIVLATRLGDAQILDQVLSRAQAAEASPSASYSLALRRARSALRDPARLAQGEAIVRDAFSDNDEPRRTLWLVVAAARRGAIADAATALEERAQTIGAVPEGAILRLRAAQLALDADDAPRAVRLLTAVQQALPTLSAVDELLAVARRKAGDPAAMQTVRAVSATADAPGDAFAQLIRDAEAAIDQGQTATAMELYQRALELRPGEPLAALPLRRVAWQLRDIAVLTTLVSAQLRAAEAAGNGPATAEAYGQFALIDAELRRDTASASSKLERGLHADPTRLDFTHRLQREIVGAERSDRVLRLRRAELDQLPLDLAADRAALLMDIAGLAERDRHSGVELAPLYRDVLAADPKHRQALFFLESLIRRAGASLELAQLEEQVARFYEGDARAQAAFYTRAGETLADIDQIDAAVQKFGMADEVLPGHVPALASWRTTAMKGQLWIDVAQAVTRLAATVADAATRAGLHHFAGVALMDKALVGEQAVASFRRALDADSRHKDAFVRLRILLEEDANHDELAVVLQNRLQVEDQAAAKLEIHRALAELHRNFLDSRDAAKAHYREILAAEPNDLRAHAAIADIAWEQGNWQEAADALIARARLERDAVTLSTLCYRLGLLYADRLSDPAMALRAFQRALTYQPDDINTLVRLVDLASVAGEWKLALGACERLVTIERDPDLKVAHLHRVAKVFRLGFGDAKRAERALNLALDGAPTNDDALTQLVQFYREAGDMTSVRVHLNRVIGAMRARIQGDPADGTAYRVIARAMAARDAAGVAGSLPVARVAAELAILLEAAGEPEHRLVAAPQRIALAPLLNSDADDLLFPRGVQPELRQMFRLLDDRVAKHVGVDLQAYGVGRADRLRARDSHVVEHVQDVANALGFGEVDVYVSAKLPYAMIAEPASPWSVIMGQRIAEADGKAVRFAAGAALKLAQVGLAIPARLDAEALGHLMVALMRCFQPEFPSSHELDDEAIAMQVQKLRRLIPANLQTELRPLALAVGGATFSYQQLRIDLQIAGLRAGLVASGSLIAGLKLLAGRKDIDVLRYLRDREAQQFIGFAIGEDHASIAR